MPRFGKYQTSRLLGRGAYGQVFEAILEGPLEFRKRVALKFLAPQAGEGGAFLRALAREARIGGLLRHPNVAEILELGEADGRYFLAMEYVDGVTLEDLAFAALERGAPLDPALVLRLAEQACAGLGYVHRALDLEGRPLFLVHRDIKPSNLMLDRQGVLKILDFGIARAEAGAGTGSATEGLRGTLRYLSPEQIRAPGEVDHRADLFALGAVLYELLTGAVLFDAPTVPAVLDQILHQPFGARADQVDARLPGAGRVLARMLEKDPAQRYPDAAAIASDLALLGQPVSQEELTRALATLVPVVERTMGGPPAPTEEPADAGHTFALDPGADKAAPSRRRRSALAAAGALGILAGGALLWWTPWKPTSQPGEAEGTVAIVAPPLQEPEVPPTGPGPLSPADPTADESGIHTNPTPEDPEGTPGEQGGTPTKTPPMDPPPPPPSPEPSPPVDTTPGEVFLAFTPMDVDIYTDGELYMEDVEAPLWVPLAPGTHQIRIVCKAPSCATAAPRDLTVEVEPGSRQRPAPWDFKASGGGFFEEGH